MTMPKKRIRYPKPLAKIIAYLDTHSHREAEAATGINRGTWSLLRREKINPNEVTRERLAAAKIVPRRDWL